MDGRHASWDRLVVSTDPHRSRLSLPASAAAALGVASGVYLDVSGSLENLPPASATTALGMPRAHSAPQVQSPSEDANQSLMTEARVRGRRSATSHSSSSILVSQPTEDMCANKRHLADAVDISHLSSREQEKVLQVLDQAFEADEEAARHSRCLREQQLSMMRESCKPSPGACPFCVRSLLLCMTSTCCMCATAVCEKCARQVDMPGADGKDAVTVCKLCYLKRRVMLSSCGWRGDVQLGNDCEVAPSVPGYGMVLMCGLKSDGGVLRTFIIDAPVGGAAHRSGLSEGDEVLAWCDRSLVGRNFKGVCEIIRHACHHNIAVKTRQYLADGRVFESSHDVHTIEAVSPGYFVHRMLANPTAIGFSDGLDQVIDEKQPLYRPYGRILLRLGFDVDNELTVAVLKAECLPALKPNVPPSPSVSVSVGGGETFSTSECRKTRHPMWNEEVGCSVPRKLDGCVIRVAVKSPKTFFGKLTLGVCCINAGEAVLGHSCQWYALQPPAVSATATYHSLCPPTELCKHMLHAHWRKIQGSSSLNSTSSHPRPSTADSKRRVASLTVNYQGQISPIPVDESGSSGSEDPSTHSARSRKGSRFSLSATGFPVSHRPRRKKVALGNSCSSLRGSASSSSYQWHKEPEAVSRSVSSLLDLGNQDSDHCDNGNRRESAAPGIFVTPELSASQELAPTRTNQEYEHSESSVRTRSASVAAAMMFRGVRPSSHDALSMISSLSSDSCGDVSILNYTGGVVQDAGVHVTLLPSASSIRVLVGEVHSATQLTDVAGMKQSDVIGIGVKVSMHAIGAPRLKRKTGTLPLNSELDFACQFEFHCSVSVRLYTLRIQVVAKMKQRSLLKKKSTVLAYCLIPFQDRKLTPGSSETEVVKVFSKPKKAP